MSCSLCLCFFFFKQKTAYEMRISDWSSDVCSSDLYGFAFEYVNANRLLQIKVGARCQGVNGLPRMPVIGGADEDEIERMVSKHLPVIRIQCGDLPRCQIGRESCRERVCQYV